MFHKNVTHSFWSRSTVATTSAALPNTIPSRQSSPAAPRLTLVPSTAGSPHKQPSALVDLVAISAHRCSAFFAEAAVLVLVLALLDRFMLKGRMEIGWVVSAFAISITMLSASIATEFAARRWLSLY